MITDSSLIMKTAIIILNIIHFIMLHARGWSRLPWLTSTSSQIIKVSEVTNSFRISCFYSAHPLPWSIQNIIYHTSIFSMPNINLVCGSPAKEVDYLVVWLKLYQRYSEENTKFVYFCLLLNVTICCIERRSVIIFVNARFVL